MPITDFDAVFTEHADFAWRVLARYGVRDSELEDACQEVFIVVFASLARFEGRSSLKTWIYGICRRIASNIRQRASYRREVPSSDQAEPSAPATVEGEGFDRVAQKQSLELLQQLLDELSASQRQVFELYEIEEIGMREVADMIGCPLHTAYARLYAARREFTASLTRLRADRRVA